MKEIVTFLKDGYNKNVVPVPVFPGDTKRGPVNVEIYIDLLKLVYFDEPSYSIEIQS